MTGPRIERQTGRHEVSRQRSTIKRALRRSQRSKGTNACVDGRRWVSGMDPQTRGDRGMEVVLSVRQRLIELEFGNGFRIGRVEPAGLIELENALGRRPSGR